LLGLPKSGGVLFALQIEVYPLSEWRQDASLAQGLARALRTMPEEMAGYKGLDTVRQELADWLTAG